ncbi:hypothetical protein [Nitrosopumilus sp.]|uniref:hypothetical protein n=1 Tax=Nitrosopumilus sp. TaxID=2024843 RepID=UPI00247E4B2E|nr:hypothetical protein [Nitrosopumilus sp.]MCV0430719.1 hypothetical protein [Nitrosopumilus sp.]
MITREEIIQILRQREARLKKWLDEKPNKKSVLQLKQDFKKWSKDIDDSRRLAQENDPLFPKDSLNSSYTFMNMFGATFANYVVAIHYIKKLEEELKKLRTKTRLNS